MKFVKSLAIISVLVAAGCDDNTSQKNSTQPSGAISSQSTTHDYQCQSGETIVATYPTTDSATIQYKGNSYDLTIAVTGSGARYVGGDFEWRTKGSDGWLFRHNADGTTGDSIEACTES